MVCEHYNRFTPFCPECGEMITGHQAHINKLRKFIADRIKRGEVWTSDELREWKLTLKALDQLIERDKEYQKHKEAGLSDIPVGMISL